MGQFLLFVLGCVIGLFWVSLFLAYRNRNVCADGWEFCALVGATMLTTLRYIGEAIHIFGVLVWELLRAGFSRVREAHKRLQEKKKAKSE